MKPNYVKYMSYFQLRLKDLKLMILGSDQIYFFFDWEMIAAFLFIADAES